MNPSGGKASSMPGMDMPGDAKAGDRNSQPAKQKPLDTKSRDDKSMPGMNMPAAPNPKKNIAPAGNSSSQALQHTRFAVSGNCGMCKERIEKAARSIKGVTTAFWDDKTKMITVAYNSSDEDIAAIQKAIARVGHDTGKYKADDKVYNSLPDCCKYRK
jgi:copper chaperone CopZ